MLQFNAVVKSNTGALGLYKAGIHTAWCDSGRIFEQGRRIRGYYPALPCSVKRKGENNAFCNIDLLDENFECKRGQYVGVKDGRIAYIGDTEPQEDYGERYDGKHRLLMSGFTTCTAMRR